LEPSRTTQKRKTVKELEENDKGRYRNIGKDM
jgi:hypothetical protein